MKSFEYTIRDKQGLHMRPAGLLAKQASGYPCAVTLEKPGKAPANAKSVFGIMGLAVKQGEPVTVRCDGDDEALAARELEAFFTSTL